MGSVLRNKEGVECTHTHIHIHTVEYYSAIKKNEICFLQQNACAWKVIC